MVETRIKAGEEPTPVSRQYGIGEIRLRDVRREDVQQLIGMMLMRGYSVQAAKHVKTVVSAIYTHAQQEGWFSGQNPAKFVKLPEMSEPHPMPSASRPVADPPRDAADHGLSGGHDEHEYLRDLRASVETGNLTMAPIIMDAELLPPLTAAVREQYYKNHWGSTKAKARRRNIPIPEWAINALAELRKRDRWTGPEDSIFAGASGKPVCENAIVQRHLKPAGITLGMPWLSWHDLRRTFATLADGERISIGERTELMGHSRAEQTLQYTHTPSHQAREVLEALAGKLVKSANLDGPTKSKVVSMQKAVGQ